MSHQVGDVIRVTADFVDFDGQPATPTSAKFFIKPPDSEDSASELTFDYPGDDTSLVSTGKVRLTLPRSVTIDGGAGTYFVEAWGLGTYAKMLPSSFVVEPRNLLTEPPV